MQSEGDGMGVSQTGPMCHWVRHVSVCMAVSQWVGPCLSWCVMNTVGGTVSQ